MSSVCAQTLTESQLRDEYFAIKRNMVMAFKNSPPVGVDPNEPPHPPEPVDSNPIVVFDCGFTEGVDYQRLPDTRTEVPLPKWAKEFHSIAKDIVQFKDAVGDYPENVWRPKLIEIEDVWMRRVIARHKDPSIRSGDATDSALVNLIASLNRYRSTHRNNPKLRPLVPYDGCGAGETAATIKTVPPATRLRLIPEFFAQICEQNNRPTPPACPYWIDVPKSDVSVSGVYRYIVNWPGTPERIGKIDFDKLLKTGELNVVEIKR